MSDFLSGSNPCGETLLKLVARGNAIIAEILRLSDFIPPDFLRKPSPGSNLAEILMDFSYFKNQEAHTKKLAESPTLLKLTEELKENNQATVERFYLALESIYKFGTDLNRFAEDLEDGRFIQHSLESVLATTEGCQLLAEAIHLYGVQLLLVDARIPGEVRERMLVFFVRNGGTHVNTDTNVEQVCSLLAATGYDANQGFKSRPVDYPDRLFKRMPLNEELVQLVFGRLRNDDLYHHLKAYPRPNHRSTALSAQAALLFITIHFLPNVLHSESAIMREIVDKFFPDNWVLVVYGSVLTFNLVDAWEPYKAARSALQYSLQVTNVRSVCKYHAGRLEALQPIVEDYLKEGALTIDQLLDGPNKLLNVLRDCNTTLRWFLLHLSNYGESRVVKAQKNLKELVRVESKYSVDQLLTFLLDTSQLEFRLKQMFKELLRSKKTRWNSAKKECEDRMDELGEVFSGAKPLSRVEKNENLQRWFLDMKRQIGSLKADEATAAGRKIVQLVQAFEEVQEFHGLELNLHVKQFLNDTRDYLRQMLRIINIREEYLATMEVVTDLSYGWQLIEAYTSAIQLRIKQDPRLVIKLRATFLKLASGLETPLMRITQCNSPDTVSVSQHYSGELVLHVRKVLQIIPETMFNILDEVVALLSGSLTQLPAKIDKERIADHALFDERFQVAKLTHSASVLTQGILMMKTTLVGVIKIDPRQLLEDGIRKELVRQVATSLHKILVFNSSSRMQNSARLLELNKKLEDSAAKLDGLRVSFEYMTDYVHVYGLKLWHEEVARVFNYSIEQECNKFLRKKVYDEDSPYQSRHIPIPKFAPLDQLSYTCMGRLGREILKLTEPNTSVYVAQMRSWYDSKTREILVGEALFNLLMGSIGSVGLSGIDRLYSFMVVKSLQAIEAYLSEQVLKERFYLDTLASVVKQITPLRQSIENPLKLYSTYLNKLARIFPPWVDALMKVGQTQLLRMHIAAKLSVACQCDSEHLYAALTTFNNAVVADIRAHYRDPSSFPYPSEDPLLADLSLYLEQCGIANPLTKIYITSENVKYFAMLMSLLVLHSLNRFSYIQPLNSFMPNSKNKDVDGVPLIIGILTFMRQFSSQFRSEVFAVLGQYVRSSLINLSKGSDFPQDVLNILVFFEQFMYYSKIDRAEIESFIPPLVLSHFRNLSAN